MTSYHSKPVPVHRKILERKLGRPIKKGYHACHTCDVRNCLNADHLWEGSQTQNNKDMAAKGRYNYHRSHYTHCRNGHPLFGENMRITKQDSGRARHARESLGAVSLVGRKSYGICRLNRKVSARKRYELRYFTRLMLTFANFRGIFSRGFLRYILGVPFN